MALILNWKGRGSTSPTDVRRPATQPRLLEQVRDVSAGNTTVSVLSRHISSDPPLYSVSRQAPPSGHGRR